MSLISYSSSGHSIGFCKRDNQYHFMDCNYGWFRFDNADDFKKWFSFYCNITNYNEEYAEYQISEYYITQKPFVSKVIPTAFIPKIKLLTVLLLVSPFLVLSLAAFLTYHFIIRGIIYYLLSIKNIFSTSASPEAPLNTISKEHLNREVPQPLEPLDLEVSTKKRYKKICLTSDYDPISETLDNPLLDIPIKDLLKAQKRSEDTSKWKKYNPTLDQVGFFGSKVADEVLSDPGQNVSTDLIPIVSNTNVLTG